jgi:hypothetical protein
VSLIHNYTVVLERSGAIPFGLSAVIVLAGLQSANSMLFPNAGAQIVYQEHGIGRARNVLWPLILTAILYPPTPRPARKSVVILAMDQTQTLNSRRNGREGLSGTLRIVR